MSLCQAAEPTTWQATGSKRIMATTADQQRILLGHVHFGGPINTPQGGQIPFQIDWRTELDGPFKDHFLSMREFKCLDGAHEITCQVPYPHPNPRSVWAEPSATQWAWLEHHLMFFFKRPNDFGAKLWNGIYFELRLTSNGLLGTPKAVDLNLIALSKSQAPYKPALRDDMPVQARWIRSISVE
jgi:hypothetical protein